MTPRPTRDNLEDLDFPLEEERPDLLEDLTDNEPEDDELPDIDDGLLDGISDALEDLDADEPPATNLDELPEDEDTDVWSLLDDDDSLPGALPEEVVLPWSTRAEIPALDIVLPAVLDPTREDSEWVTASPPERDRVEVLLVVGPVEVRTALSVRTGDSPRLVLGRDVLAGRILVRS